MRFPSAIARAALLVSAFLVLVPAGRAQETAESLLLWPEGQAPQGDGTFQAEAPQIFIHRAPHPNGAAFVICPGGGYRGQVLGPEGHGIAAWLNEHGVAGIVLQYRLPKGRPGVPLLDAQRALRLARLHAREWGLDPARVGIIGFSAGGHLASTLATHFDSGHPESGDPIERVSCRPDFGILVYPVVTMGEEGHAGSRNNLLGPNPTLELVERYSNEKQVTEQTPPLFLAHAQDDKVVPISNSQRLYDALLAHHVRAKFLPLVEGGHGLSGYHGPMWDLWQAEALRWLTELGVLGAPGAPAGR